MSFPLALLHPRLLGHLTDTRSSAKAFLHSAATPSRISSPPKAFQAPEAFPPRCPHFRDLSANTGWAKGGTLQPHPSPGGLAPLGQGGRQNHEGPSLGLEGGTHAHTTAHVCTHTGSVHTSRAHRWPDSHRTGSSCPSARAGVSTHTHTDGPWVPADTHKCHPSTGLGTQTHREQGSC